MRWGDIRPDASYRRRFAIAPFLGIRKNVVRSAAAQVAHSGRAGRPRNPPRDPSGLRSPQRIGGSCGCGWPHRFPVLQPSGRQSKARPRNQRRGKWWVEAIERLTGCGWIDGHGERSLSPQKHDFRRARRIPRRDGPVIRRLRRGKAGQCAHRRMDGRGERMMHRGDHVAGRGHLREWVATSLRTIRHPAGGNTDDSHCCHCSCCAAAAVARGP